MEEQCPETSDPKATVDSAYGSLESSSNGQSQKSYSALESKSQNSGSTHGSTEYTDPKSKGARQKDKKRRKSKDRPDLSPKETCEPQSTNEQRIKELESSSDQLSRSTEPDGCERTPKTDYAESAKDRKNSDYPSLVYSQALHYIRKIKENSTEQGIKEGNSYLDEESNERKDLTSILQKSTNPKGFTVAISVQDGSILQASSSITEVLGFPKELLLGHSLIELVHPKDTISLSSKIIHGLNVTPNADGIVESPGSTFFCRLRMYHSLRNGFGIRNRKRSYKPCKIIFRHHLCKPTETNQQHKWFILAEVFIINSAYENPEETVGTGNFVIRHSATCSFSEYDSEAIRYLGHLPQDLIGNSVFDCYHPEDLPKLKTVYEEIIRNEGQPYRSEPYRFQTFNGSWVTLMTEWLCFVNPWTKKIESIIGRHRILKGPKEIAIFNDTSNKAQFSDEILANAEKAKSQILELLQKPVSSFKDPSKEPTVKRRRNMAAIVSPFVAELDTNTSVTGAGGPSSENTSTSKSEPTPHNNTRKISKDQLSVVIGNISPHQDVRWSEPPITFESPSSSYHQLNYTETLERFFRSNPKTVSSDESADNRDANSQQDSMGLSNSDSANNKSGSGTSGHISGDLNSSVSKSSSPSKENREKVSTGTKGDMPSLTEAMLTQHNELMQKNFVAKRKGRRKIISRRRFPHRKKHYRDYLRPLDRVSSVKRHMAEDDSFPSWKHVCGKHQRLDSDSSVLQKTLSTTHNKIKPTDLHSSALNPVGHNVVQESCPKAKWDYRARLFPSTTEYVISNNHQKNPIEALNPPTCGHCGYHQSSMTSQTSSLHNQSSTHYFTPSRAVLFQQIVPPLVNAPPVMLPKTAYEHTTVPHLRAEEKTDTRGDQKHKRAHSEVKGGSVKNESDAKRAATAPDNAMSPLEDFSCLSADFLKQASQFSQSTSVRAEAESLGSFNKKSAANEQYNSSDAQLSYKSSFLSEEGKSTDDSFPMTLGSNEKSTTASESSHKLPRPVLSDPHWLKAVDVTHDLMFKYQLPTTELNELLKKDMEFLQKTKQPTGVDEQLSLLYKEMELNGDNPNLNLEESSNSSEDLTGSCDKESSRYYSQMSMLYEEDAPMPPAVRRQDKSSMATASQ